MAVAGKRGFYFWVEENQKPSKSFRIQKAELEQKILSKLLEGDDFFSFIQLLIKPYI